jgi:hypothetical protein
MNTIAVEFPDGFLTFTSRYAVRHAAGEHAAAGEKAQQDLFTPHKVTPHKGGRR